jgi:microcystin-dependent protein
VSQPFIGEVRIASFNFAPRGWALCNGQLLPINQNAALFSLLGTTYGGNGTTNFQLPNLQGRTPISFSNSYPLGNSGGEENHTLLSTEIPQHNHSLNVSGNAATSAIPTGRMLASSGQNIYAPASAGGTLNPQSVGSAGGSQAHSNVQPFLVLNFIIALQGIFPSQN